MIKIAILSQKGGAGKTTLSLNLGVAAELDGRETAIIDLDPQSSSSEWGDSREAEGPTVITAPANRLSVILKTCEDNGAGMVIMDTAPHSEQTALAAARAADLVIIPCRPSIVDLRAVPATIELCNIAKVPCRVILNQTPPRGTLAEEAEAAIKGLDVETTPIQIGQRIAYIHAVTAGLGVLEYEPKGKAADEIRALYDYILKETGHGKAKKKTKRRAA